MDTRHTVRKRFFVLTDVPSKVLNPEKFHLTCVAETVRLQFSLIDSLIVTVLKVFPKVPGIVGTSIHLRNYALIYAFHLSQLLLGGGLGYSNSRKAQKHSKNFEKIKEVIVISNLELDTPLQ